MFRTLSHYITLRNIIWVIVCIIWIIGLWFAFDFIKNIITEDTKSQARNRSSLFAGSIKSEIEKKTVAPRIIANTGSAKEAFLFNPAPLNAELIKIGSQFEQTEFYAVNKNGHIIASSDTEALNTRYDNVNLLSNAIENQRSESFDIDLLTYISVDTVYTNNGEFLGFIVSEVNFEVLSTLWMQLGARLLVINSRGDVLISGEEQFRNTNIREILSLSKDIAYKEIPFEKSYDIGNNQLFAFSTEVGINGWKIIYFSNAAETERYLNAVIGIMIFLTIFLMLIAAYIISRQEAKIAIRLKREGEELRALNTQLISEIDQRRKAEGKLKTAEQSLEQSSKLVQIGQMAAAVGHELNQPLTAMRTYLSTVRLLAMRGRMSEAATSLVRVEDLIARMGSITSQLRSFARVHDAGKENFDLKDALTDSIELISPMLAQFKIRLTSEFASKKAMVSGDKIRTEQIIINVLRNAIDAVKEQEERNIHIEIKHKSDLFSLLISDNGGGFESPEKVFEPFYSTKGPGEGLGLGLAISASYAVEMGGKLLATDDSPNGAIFELQLPLANT